MPLISIIVPVYNVNKYIQESIISVLKQGFDSFELIIIDDGSVDESGEICDQLCCSDHRITVCHMKNSGLSNARNTGLQLIFGDSFMFLDGDDRLSANALNTLYQNLFKNNSDICVCNYQIIDEYNNVISDFIVPDLHNELIDRKTYFSRLCGPDDWIYVTACNKLYKRFLKDYILFPQKKLHEDEYMIHEIISHCSSIAVISEKLYCYTQRQGSITHTESFRSYCDASEALLERSSFFIKQKCYDEAVYSIQASLGRLFRASLCKEKNSNEVYSLLHCLKDNTLLVLKNDKKLLPRMIRTLSELNLFEIFRIYYHFKS